MQLDNDVGRVASSVPVVICILILWRILFIALHKPLYWFDVWYVLWINYARLYALRLSLILCGQINSTLWPHETGLIVPACWGWGWHYSDGIWMIIGKNGGECFSHRTTQYPIASSCMYIPCPKTSEMCNMSGLVYPLPECVLKKESTITRRVGWRCQQSNSKPCAYCNGFWVMGNIIKYSTMYIGLNILLVARAVEIFLHALLTRAAGYASSRSAKTLTVGHL